MPQAQAILKQVFGFHAFRGAQRAIIDTLLQGQHAFVMMPTGGGKSLCYQIPALIREGLAIVVSPLIALMQDQVSALLELNISAACWHGHLSDAEQKNIEHAIQMQQLKILYVSPERVMTARCLNLLQSIPLALIAIDEAHCLSQWGHDFRPEYPRLREFIARFPDVPRLALTATADEQTQRDIRHYLALTDAQTFKESLFRSNLRYHVVEKHQAKQQLLSFIRTHHPNQSGIVYCLSRQKVETLAAWLRGEGVETLVYHAGLAPDVRAHHQHLFVRSESCVMVATVAFGMGIHKPNVRFVAHLDLPRSLEHFYQESGRAGRDGEAASCWLCYGLSDWISWQQRLQSGQYDHDEQGALLVELQQKRLQAVFEFGEHLACRQQILLAYFGESVEPCGVCDRCLNPPQCVDNSLEYAQKILSCIYRAEQRASASEVVEILLGRASRYAHLSTFGVGKGVSARAWRGFLRQLLAQKMAQIWVDEQGVARLGLTELSKVVLRGQQEVSLRWPVLKSSSKSRASGIWLRTERQERLWQALRIWRKQTAAVRDVPPYLIFSDESLRALVEHLPSNEQELKALHGFGTVKIAHYGADVLAIISEHGCNEG